MTNLKESFEERMTRLIAWLGEAELEALIPVSNERVKQALAMGDLHLNTIMLATWDKCHGYEKEKPQRCQCCNQIIPIPASNMQAGVLGLVRNAIRRDRKAGKAPQVRGWSMSDSVCVLKTVARNRAERNP